MGLDAEGRRGRWPLSVLPRLRPTRARRWELADPQTASAQPVKSIFVSYAPQDEPRVRELVECLRVLGYDVWFDEAHLPSQELWDHILEQIRACDIFIQALSASAMASTWRERRYAVALGKQVLLVMLEEIPEQLMPGDVAGLHVDYF